MFRNEGAVLFFDLDGKFKIGIGGGIKAAVIMDSTKSCITYVTCKEDGSNVSKIISTPLESSRQEIVSLLTKNFEDGKVDIEYDGEIDSSNNVCKAYISRIIILQPLIR